MSAKLKKLLPVFSLFIFSHFIADAQAHAVKKARTKQYFDAGWIAPPGVNLKDYGVYHFRKMLNLTSRLASFVIHISADNRYWLFVNGISVACGPQRSDVAHWRYETLDLKPYLKAGKNIIAVTVWNQGEDAAWGQLSMQTGLWIEGEGIASAINTDTSWRVIKDQAYSPIVTNQHVVGPFEQVDANQYPWGWNLKAYNDKQWPGAVMTEKGKAFKNDMQAGRQMLKRNIPLPEEKPQRFARIRRAEGITADDGFIKGTKALVIPPNSNVKLLLDQDVLTTAYPALLVSAGKNSKVTITYSESLYTLKGDNKGNRSDIDGKYIKGNEDIFIANGGDKRLFRPLYYRTFRYVQLHIETKHDPLIINDFSSSFTAYPFKENAGFNSSDTSLRRIWDVGWRTSRLCAYETYMDCPYYEQMQYIGDTRIESLISMYVSGDDRLVKNAISQFDQSRIKEGLTQSRYPSNKLQVIPPFSLFWIAMLHDYWMIGKDTRFVKNLLPGVEKVLKWHEKYISKQGMLGKMPYWNFVDWPAEWPWKGSDNISGIPNSALTGNSAVLTLQYVYALNYAAELYRGYGLKQKAMVYEALAQKLKTATYNACWDDKRGLMADAPDKKEFSQHTNSMAVLTGTIPARDQQRLLLKMVKDTGIIQCTIYYRFYMIQAFKKAGLGNEYFNLLAPWYHMLDMGLTTFAERPEPTRSDCHAWSASPDYELLATVCGITPLKPAFKQVRIAPQLGSLTWVDAKMPHPLGLIKIHLEKKDKYLYGIISLPKGLDGEFVWNKKAFKLRAGRQKIKVMD